MEKSQCRCGVRMYLVVLLLVCGGLLLTFDQRILFILDTALHPVMNITSGNPATSSRVTTKLPVFEVNPNSPCTFQLLRDYQKYYGYFPGNGTWNLTSSPPYYQPSICKFKYPRIPMGKVQDCLRTASVTSVMTIGDSNGLHNFEQLHRFVYGCEGVGAEGLTGGGFIPNPNYYKKGRPQNNIQEWSRYLKVHYRHCSGCAGKRVHCTNKGTNSTVAFEHMAMTLIIDDQMRLEFGSYGEAARAFNKVWALTTQEVYFKYFLHGRYPNVFLVFLPFNHMKLMSHERLRLDIQYFRSLLRLYFPSSTKVFYIPTFGEFSHGLPSDKMEKENWKRSEAINLMNRVMYEVLEGDFLSPESNTYGFLDLVNVSRPVAHWCLDGQHMKPAWYQAVMSMFWETFCNSVQQNAF